VFVYPRWSIDATAAEAYWAPAAAAAVVVLLWVSRHRIGRTPLAAVLYFALTLSPALGFFDVFYTRYSPVADRWQYLACIGLIAGVVGGVRVGVNRLGRGAVAPAVAALALLLVACGTLTWREASHYRDAETLWRATLEDNPRAFAAHNNLGGLLLQRGETPEAETHFREAIRIQPDFPESYNNLGIVLHNRGRVDEAIRQYLKAIQLFPAYAEAHNNLGVSLAAQGRIEEAMEQFEQALRLQPQLVNALRNLGTALLHLGRVDEALTQLELAARHGPGSAETWVLLGRARARQGLSSEAAAAYRQALALAPRSGEAALALAWMLATDPNPEGRDGGEAVRLAELALRRVAGDPARRYDVLAAAYAEAGRYPEAVASAAQALELARRTGQTELAADVASRLGLYESRQPFRVGAGR
jgi:tetratricopeptide (TPR) repeat protein